MTATASEDPQHHAQTSTGAKPPLDDLDSTTTLPVLPSLARTQGADGGAETPRSFQSQEEGPERRMHRLEMDEGEGISRGLRPVDGGKDAVLFLVAAFILECFVWGYSYSFSTILVYLQSHDPWQKNSVSSLSAIGTTQLGIQLLLPMFIMNLYRRYPDWVKTIMWISVVVSCTSMLISSWATQLWQLVLLQGVVCATANTFLYCPVFIWVGEWWVERRSMAWGVVQAGTGAGGLIFPFVINSVLNKKGFPTMCRVWAGITAAVFTVAVVFSNPRIPAVKPKGGRVRWLAVDWKVFRSPIFFVVNIAALFGSLSWMPVSNYLAVYASSFSSSTLTIDLVVGLLNLAACLGSVATGLVSNYSYPLATVLCGVAGALVGVLAWGYADSLAKVYAFAVLFGFTSQTTATWGAAAQEVAGSNPHMSALAVCVFSAVRGIASLFMPAVSSALYDSSKATRESAFGQYGFAKLIAFVGITAFLLAVTGVVLLVMRRWSRRK
ncbi:hypothetical protein JCM6882_003405 [Rhodosporidiobolus microsporus]